MQKMSQEQANPLKPPFSFNEFNQSLPTVWKWGKRVGFSILDQGLFSGANFALNILLARWLTPEDYGAFAVAYAVYLFSSGFHYALILDPMAVFGPLINPGKHMDYVKKSFLLQLFISLALGALIGLAGILVRAPLGEALIGIAFCTPFILTMTYFRNSFYIKSESAKSALVSFIFFFVIVASLIAAKFGGILQLKLSFLFLAGSSFLSSVAGFALYIQRKQDSRETVNFRDILVQNWSYGKWIVLTALANSITTLSFPLLIGVFIGLTDAAAFRGWQNLISPMYQALTAGALLVIPILSQRSNSLPQPAKIIKNLFLAMILSTLFYIILINLNPKSIISMLYKQVYYLNYSWLLSLFSIYLMFLALSSFFSVFIRAGKQSKYLYYSKFVAAFGYFAILPIIKVKPLLSTAMVMLLVVTLIETILLFLSYLKMRRNYYIDTINPGN